jgi:ATP-dependent exoDNAse (exonuclease V) alpha subunit
MAITKIMTLILDMENKALRIALAAPTGKAARACRNPSKKRRLLVLSGRDIPLITRELIYTGITRARKFVDIWAGEDLLQKAISRRIYRKSGLADVLQKPPKEILSNSKPIQ